MKKLPRFYKSVGLYKNAHGFLKENLEKHGNFYQYKGLIDFYFLNDPNEIRKVLLQSNTNYSRVTKVNKPLASIITKNNILFDEPEDWKRKRSIMNSFFEKKNLVQYYDLMKIKVTEVTSEIETEIGNRNSKSIDIYHFCSEIIIKIIFGAFFSKNPKKDDIEKMMMWIDEIKNYTSQSPIPIVSNIIFNTKIRKVQKKFDQYIKHIITERNTITIDTNHRDLLSYMIKIYSKKLPNGSLKIDKKGITKETLLMILSGYETSAYTATSIFYFLAQNPDKYKKLQQEIDTTFNGIDPSPQTIMELKYADQVLNEVLRIDPAIWITARKSNKDVQISGEALKKNSTILLCPHFAHLDEKYWDSPNEFIPERWEDEKMKNINKSSYIPFGSGPRKCIGMEFSIAEVKIIMVLMLIKFEFSIDPSFKLKTNYGVTAYPDGGHKMILSIRD